MNGPQTPAARRQTLEILQDLEAVRENLLGLSDEIWLSIDHNDEAALADGVAFKQEFNAKIPEESLSIFLRQDRDVQKEDGC